MNWKQVFLGAVVFWVVTNVFGMFVTGYLIHDKILDPDYRAHSQLWVPELNQDPPDMAALIPNWLTISFITSLVVAGIYSRVKGSFSGPAWKKGLTWGFCVGLLASVSYFALTGFMALSTKIAIWWSIDALILYVLGGAAMGWAVAKWASD